MNRRKSRIVRNADRVAATATGRDNLFLAALPVRERTRLLARCETVDWAFEDRLCEPGERIRHVYFPTGGFISLLSSVDGRSRLEVGLIGTEGMLGVSLLVGVTEAPLRALVQGAGPALRVEATHFLRELKRSPELRQALTRYLYVLMSQLAQMVACARFHFIEARLARWLLMTRDRAHSSEFYLTQDFLSQMLGVRRVGITRAAGLLHRRKLIRYSRGRITIIDQRGLERASCECYAVEGLMYARLMDKEDNVHPDRGH